MSFDKRSRDGGPTLDDTDQGHEGQGGNPRAQLAQRRRMMQRKAERAVSAEAHVERAAQLGSSGGGGPLPHLERIQQSFGRARRLGVARAHHGAAPRAASGTMGAEALRRRRRDVAFAGAPTCTPPRTRPRTWCSSAAASSCNGGVGAARRRARAPRRRGRRRAS